MHFIRIDMVVAVVHMAQSEQLYCANDISDDKR